MGVFDLPLEELKKYQGSTPCPTDFDEFWDKSVEEAKHLEWNLELKKMNFKQILQSVMICSLQE